MLVDMWHAVLTAVADKEGKVYATREELLNDMPLAHQASTVALHKTLEVVFTSMPTYHKDKVVSHRFQNVARPVQQPCRARDDEWRDDGGIRRVAADEPKVVRIPWNYA